MIYTSTDNSNESELNISEEFYNSIYDYLDIVPALTVFKKLNQIKKINDWRNTYQNHRKIYIFSEKRLIGRTHWTVYLWRLLNWRIWKSHRVTLGNLWLAVQLSFPLNKSSKTVNPNILYSWPRNSLSKNSCPMAFVIYKNLIKK